MTPPDEGLPLPPLRPQPPPPAAPRPDLAPGTVDRLLETSRSASETRTIHFQDRIGLRRDVDPEISRFVAFSESGPNALGEVQSTFETAVLGNEPDPSTLGLLRAIGGAVLVGTSSPVGAITDQYQVSRIRELQRAFYEANNDSLLTLGEKLSAAKLAIRRLGELLANSPFRASRLSDLLERKRRLGDATLRDLDDALAQSTDPDERARLHQMRDDLTAWMEERDARTAAEYDEVGALVGRLQGLEGQMYRQRGLLEQAAWSEGPRNLTSGGRVVETSHHRPDAIAHAASLQDMLLGSKAAFDRLLLPE